MNSYGRTDVRLHPFLTSTLGGGEKSASFPESVAPLPIEKGAGWASRAGLNALVKRKSVAHLGNGTTIPHIRVYRQSVSIHIV